tara:strand:+ start:164 stop:475 length:312 start_codon:yes stop_codon:yes gene_type:complete
MSSNQAYANDLELAYFGWDESLSVNNIISFTPYENITVNEISSGLKSIVDRFFIRLILFSLSIILMFEELEWITFSSKNNIKEKCIDKTEWNINNILEKMYVF